MSIRLQSAPLEAAMTPDYASSTPVSASRTGHVAAVRSTLLRAAVTAGVAGALAIGASTLPTGTSAPEISTTTAAVRLTGGFCPFGTHHGPGSGCRGGSVNNNQRLNDSLRDTGEMYLDAGECAGKAVGKSLWKNRKKPTPPSVGLGTISPAIKCGRQKGY
jgi:hypothetical protein